MEKKKIIISGLVVMILIAIVSAATYAYFIAGVTRNNTTAGVTGTTGTLASVLLRGTGLNLEIDTSVGDFYEHDNVNGVNYYAVSVGEGYASARQNHVLGQVAINGEGTFNCTYEVEVKGSNVPTNMVSGDGKVIITGDGISNGIINISDLKTTQTVNGAFTGINNTSSNTILVDAYLTNTNTEQDYLQGVNIGIEVSVKNFICTSVSSMNQDNESEMGDAGKYILATSPENISEEIIGGMYRYQGTYDKVDNNYICFGTNDKTTCTGNTDAYMYRILGITPDGQLKLVKKEALNTEYPWNEDDTKDITWEYSDIYNTINGSAYLNNPTYVPSSWLNKIEDTVWKYGDVDRSSIDNSKNPYTEVYLMEKDLTNMIQAKIGLMQLHDITYQVDEETFISSLETENMLSSRWNELTLNDVTAPHADGYEWLMTRYRFYSDTGECYAWSADPGLFAEDYVSLPLSVRPVFYLTSENTIIGGEGTISNPYLIG